jgi:hypothetical protein
VDDVDICGWLMNVYGKSMEPPRGAGRRDDRGEAARDARDARDMAPRAGKPGTGMKKPGKTMGKV